MNESIVHDSSDARNRCSGLQSESEPPGKSDGGATTSGGRSSEVMSALRPPCQISSAP